MGKRSNRTHLMVAVLGCMACGDAGSGVVVKQAISTAGAAAPNPDDVGNHFASGAWQGYFWTSSQGPGTTITPTDFNAQTTGMPRCVRGSVAATTDYSGVAVLGVNLNEANEGKQTVKPTKAGVFVDVKNNSAATLLFQIEGPSDAPISSWCTLLSGSGGFVPWSSLNTACWDNSGSAYNNEPILSAAVVVPGNTSAAVAFDFCLNALAEVDAPK